MLNRRSRAVVALTALVLMGVVLSGTGPAPDVDADRSAQGPATAGTLPLDLVLGGQTRPNIVVIMADDMRDDDLQHMPRTGRLLADQGVRFVNSFSPHPMCCPARASFATGKYTHNHHVWSNRGPYGGFPAFDDSATMPVALNEAGYATVFLGKYLNGYGWDLLPDGSSSKTYVPPGWTDWRALARGIYDYFDTTLNINGTLRRTRGWYQTRMLGAESRDVISRQARSPRPFFLWASYVSPHTGKPNEKDDPASIVQEDGRTRGLPTAARPADARDLFDSTISRAPGAEGEVDVSDKPLFIRKKPSVDDSARAALTEVARQRAEALWVLDQEVARTIRALERAGELEDTVVMFTSDNGYLLGEHRILQGKLLPYEPSLRVPLLVRGPGIPAGEVRTEPVLSIDFAPTFLELAGAQPDATIDGMSFLDANAAGDPTRDPTSDSDTGWSRAILTETGPRPLGSTTVDRTLPLGADPIRFTQGVRTGRYLYVEHATGERELYDMRSDPDQLDNLAASRPAAPVARQLAALLDELRDCTGADCQEPAPSSLHR